MEMKFMLEIMQKRSSVAPLNSPSLLLTPRPRQQH